MSVEDVMQKRQRELEERYEAQWDGGKGSHVPDFDPTAKGADAVKASRETEELLNAIVKNDIKLVYKKIEEGADVNFVFGRCGSPALMSCEAPMATRWLHLQMCALLR